MLFQHHNFATKWFQLNILVKNCGRLHWTPNQQYAVWVWDFKAYLTELKQNVPDLLIRVTALPDGGGGLCGGAGRAGGATGRGGGGRLGSKVWEDSFCWVPSWLSPGEHDKKQSKN